MIRVAFLSLLLGLTISTQAVAKSDLKDLKNSIVKIAIYMPEGPAVATAFVVSKDNQKYVVTNNHVCDGFYKSKRIVLIDSQTKADLPRQAKDFDGLDTITDYYMDAGTDICIMKSKNVDKYHPLSFNDDDAIPTDDILIAGFVGRSMDLMYVTGKVYGSISIAHPVELKSCLIDPPAPNSSGAITCNFFPEYPSYVKKTLQTAVNNIGPGFSGSPVLENGKVTGIVCRYFVPASGYSNGDVIFFPGSDIKKALEKAPKSMVSVDSKQYVRMIKIAAFDEGLVNFLKQTEEDMQGLIKDLIKEANE